MKANELMVGDWVKLKTDDGTFIKVHISALSFEYIWGIIDDDEANDAIGYDYLEPIPLTAEILEKNLSTTSQIQYCWDDFLSNSFGEDFYEIRYHGDVTELIISIRYVHELQHVLKLCKIEKEIIL